MAVQLAGAHVRCGQNAGSSSAAEVLDRLVRQEMLYRHLKQRCRDERPRRINCGEGDLKQGHVTCCRIVTCGVCCRIVT